MTTQYPPQRLRHLNLIALAAMAAFSSHQAFAQDVPGWYGGANVGQARATIDDPRIRSGLAAGGLTVNNIDHRDHDTAYKLFGGYQLNRNFALEGGYFDLGKFGYTARTTPAGSVSGDLRVKGLNLDLVGTLPLSESFSVFGRAGVNYAQTRDRFTSTGAAQITNPNPSTQGTNYKYGGGLQYAINDALSLRGELERYRVKDGVGNRGHIDLLSVGLIYRFGGKVQQPAPRPIEVVAVREVVAPPVVVAPAPPPRVEKYTLSATELFAFDSATLRGDQPKLDEVAQVLRSSPGIQNVVITGHTDRLGSNKYNQALSERRADAVKVYLVNKGVAPARLTAQGKGETEPIVVCTEKRLPALISCLEPNRRVEVERINAERPAAP